jgi:hypothetical protein
VPFQLSMRSLGRSMPRHELVSVTAIRELRVARCADDPDRVQLEGMISRQAVPNEDALANRCDRAIWLESTNSWLLRVGAALVNLDADGSFRVMRVTTSEEGLSVLCVVVGGLVKEAT